MAPCSSSGRRLYPLWTNRKRGSTSENCCSTSWRLLRSRDHPCERRLRSRSTSSCAREGEHKFTVLERATAHRPALARRDGVRVVERVRSEVAEAAEPLTAGH